MVNLRQPTKKLIFCWICRKKLKGLNYPSVYWTAQPKFTLELWVSTWSTGTIPRCGFRGPKLISPAEFIRGVSSSLKAVRRIYTHWVESSWSSKLRSFTIDTYGFLAISLKYLDVFPSTNLGRTWRCLSSTAGYPASTVAFASSPGEEKTSPYMSEQLFSHLEVMCSTSQTGGKQVQSSRN